MTKAAIDTRIEGYAAELKALIDLHRQLPVSEPEKVST